MVDCVGYMVPSALNQLRTPSRMVMTPWFDHEIPMTEPPGLAPQGKRARHHRHIGDHRRQHCRHSAGEYAEAEERVINELKESDKPFVILVNSRYPRERRRAVRGDTGKIQRDHDTVNAMTMEEEDIKGILKGIT